jgi:hypothetical protein
MKEIKEVFGNLRSQADSFAIIGTQNLAEQSRKGQENLVDLFLQAMASAEDRVL